MTYGVAFPPPPDRNAADVVQSTAKTNGPGSPARKPAPERLSKEAQGRLSRKLPLINLELTENEIQKAVFVHLRTRGAPGIFAFHPKNASSDLAGRKAGIHVGLGVEPGIPDVIVLRRRMPDCDVFALELKRESLRGKRMTAHDINQERTRSRMLNCGVMVGIAYGLDEAIAWLETHNLLLGSAR